MYSSSTQQICNGVVESLRSFKQLLKLFGKDELVNKPKAANYPKPCLFTVYYSRKSLKLTDK
ncbi:MAG: hypothetical protein F6K24_16645 [Okeania sp. SIO2D1]|nr:hypothetical protein [Okeania sp. SIO2D1]